MEEAARDIGTAAEKMSAFLSKTQSSLIKRQINANRSDFHEVPIIVQDESVSVSVPSDVASIIEKLDTSSKVKTRLTEFVNRGCIHPSHIRFNTNLKDLEVTLERLEHSVLVALNQDKIRVTTGHLKSETIFQRIIKRAGDKRILDLVKTNQIAMGKIIFATDEVFESATSKLVLDELTRPTKEEKSNSENSEVSAKATAFRF